MLTDGGANSDMILGVYLRGGFAVVDASRKEEGGCLDIDVAGKGCRLLTRAATLGCDSHRHGCGAQLTSSSVAAAKLVAIVVLRFVLASSLFQPYLPKSTCDSRGKLSWRC